MDFTLKGMLLYTSCNLIGKGTIKSELPTSETRLRASSFIVNASDFLKARFST